MFETTHTQCYNHSVLNLLKGRIYHMRKRTSRARNKQILPVLIVVALIALVLLFIVGGKLIERYTPTKDRMALTEYYNITDESQVAITLNNTVLDTYATMIDGHVYLDYDFVHDVLNSRFYWDANENILLYTTATDIISATAESTSYTIGRSSTDFGRIIVKATAESAWIDLEFVKAYSDFTYSYFESPSRLVITNAWTDITVSTLKGNTEVRYRGGIKSPILSDVKKGDVLTILEPDKKWTKVCTKDGIIGYVRSNKVKKTQTKTLVSEYVPETFKHITLDTPINLLWHPVYNSSANGNISSILSESKGVNVISPTWFRIKDNNGNVSSYASTDYVNYCHNHNVQVWGLINNLDVEGVDTAHILTHTSLRQKMVNQLVALALEYNLDGINIDFEQLSEATVGDGYIQFLRELSIKCENNDIILSTSVYSPAAYNSVYKYGEQSDFVDYVALMAYDQHYGQQSGEGSVAAMDWVEESINNTISDGVPADQLVLGIPFYSRLWKLTPVYNEETLETTYDIDEEELGWNSSKKWMNNNVSDPMWLEDCGQWYGEIEKNGKIYKMWLENKDSLEERLTLMQQYNLAGAAFWSSSLDSSEAWDVIIKYIN